MAMGYLFASSLVSPSTVPVRTQLELTKYKVMASSRVSFRPLCRMESSSLEREERVQIMDYRPTIWDYATIQSIRSHSLVLNYILSLELNIVESHFIQYYLVNILMQGSKHRKQTEKLVQTVSLLFDQQETIRAQLQLVDAVQHLGMGHLFEKEIKKVLDSTTTDPRLDHEDLYTTALHFRLLRQHSYKVSQDIFKSFRDSDGFKPNLLEDIEGVLSLYEASHLAFEGETILDEARVFTSNRLRMGDLEAVEAGQLPTKVQRALVLPTSRWIPWLEARWYMDLYQQEPWAEPAVIELSKLHFNMVQAIHRSDVKVMSSWWKDLGLASSLSFARDRLVESFYWSTALVYEPQFRYCRQQLTKACQLLTVIDDIYDVYGTLEELELFTEAIDRWDENSSIDHFPNYMKTTFEALFETMKSIRDDTIKALGRDITPHLIKAWGELCKSFMVEAEWTYKKERRPTLKEYLENGWVSVSGPLQLTFAYYLLAPKPSTYKELGSLDNYMDLIRCSSMIFRLCNDLAVSKEELEGGDSINAIKLYMNETGASEESARKYLRSSITEHWKKLSDETVSCFLISRTFTNLIINLARNAQTVYLHGDGFSVPDGYTKDCVTLLLVKSLPIGIGETNFAAFIERDTTG